MAKTSAPSDVGQKERCIFVVLKPNIMKYKSLRFIIAAIAVMMSALPADWSTTWIQWESNLINYYPNIANGTDVAASFDYWIAVQ